MDSMDLLDFVKPKLQRLAEHGVTDVEDRDQQEMVKLIAKKYLEHLERPLHQRVPVSAAPAPTAQPQVDNRDMCAPPGFVNPTAPAKKRGARTMTLQERINRARQAAREASEESQASGEEYADEAIGSPMGSHAPPVDQIQYDPHTGSPMIYARPLNLPRE